MARTITSITFAWLTLGAVQAFCQSHTLSGTVSSGLEPLRSASISLKGTPFKVPTDTLGRFVLRGIPSGTYTVTAASVGYHALSKTVRLADSPAVTLDFFLMRDEQSLKEVVVTGTMKEISRLESSVPVEVFSQAFFRKNPTPSLFDALQHVNGVRPQLNCNICNTGDIHMNGLEGPYTMILIDGMPIVSGLSSVYGLSGIPSALIERMEIVKGPASSLYGSEAVGGLINIITKKPEQAPDFSADVFGTSWGEWNTDIGLKFRAGKKATVLTGINYFRYGNPVDHNHDHFTDVALASRVSVFQKWSADRRENRLFSMAVRYNYEDRWGGDREWNRSFRGTDQRYGESIYTNRWELVGNYQLPVREKILFGFSFNDHRQNSVYGITPYIARQRIAFGQLTWDKKIRNHDILAGAAVRRTFYDDNTTATLNGPDQTWLPGIFVQDELGIGDRHKVLLGLRYDHHAVHGHILTPRFAYKWTLDDRNIIRFNAGTGFRVVTLFAEEHAALTGAREVVVEEELAPERSYNLNLNYVRKVGLRNGSLLTLDASAWYTRFSNRILPDYLTDPDKIHYRNLGGHAVSRGISFNGDLELTNGIKVLLGGTFLDVFSRRDGEGAERPLLTEKFTGTWGISGHLDRARLTIDYTGNLYGPMLLPRLSPLDPRSASSPWWSIQNIQLTHRGRNGLEVYGGVKNLLNWTPGRKEPFLIARSHDPFDKQVRYDEQGQVLLTPENPYGLTFDPGFVYGPNQGIRGFLGVRYILK